MANEGWSPALIALAILCTVIVSICLLQAYEESENYKGRLHWSNICASFVLLLWITDPWDAWPFRLFLHMAEQVILSCIGIYITDCIVYAMCMLTKTNYSNSIKISMIANYTIVIVFHAISIILVTRLNRQVWKIFADLSILIVVFHCGFRGAFTLWNIWEKVFQKVSMLEVRNRSSEGESSLESEIMRLDLASWQISKALFQWAVVVIIILISVFVSMSLLVVDSDARGSDANSRVNRGEQATTITAAFIYMYVLANYIVYAWVTVTGPQGAKPGDDYDTLYDSMTNSQAPEGMEHDLEHPKPRRPLKAFEIPLPGIDGQLLLSAFFTDSEITALNRKAMLMAPVPEEGKYEDDTHDHKTSSKISIEQKPLLGDDDDDDDDNDEEETVDVVDDEEDNQEKSDSLGSSLDSTDEAAVLDDDTDPEDTRATAVGAQSEPVPKYSSYPTLRQLWDDTLQHTYASLPVKVRLKEAISLLDSKVKQHDQPQSSHPVNPAADDPATKAAALLLYAAEDEKATPAAFFAFADALHYGNGVTQDKETSIDWYEKAAEQGYSPAQLMLAECYRNGVGVPVHGEIALEWYKLVARCARDPDAAFEAGQMLWFGDQVSSDLEESLRWYGLACSLAHPYVCLEIARRLHRQQQWQQAAEWYIKDGESRVARSHRGTIPLHERDRSRLKANLATGLSKGHVSFTLLGKPLSSGGPSQGSGHSLSLEFKQPDTVGAPMLLIKRGKIFFEAKLPKGVRVSVGWGDDSFLLGGSLEEGGYSVWLFPNSQQDNKHHYVGCFADLDEGKIIFALDGHWNESKVEEFSGVKGVFPVVQSYEACEKLKINVGGKRFKYPPPFTFNPIGLALINQVEQTDRISDLKSSDASPDEEGVIDTKAVMDTNPTRLTVERKYSPISGDRKHKKHRHAVRNPEGLSDGESPSGMVSKMPSQVSRHKDKRVDKHQNRISQLLLDTQDHSAERAYAIVQRSRRLAAISLLNKGETFIKFNKFSNKTVRRFVWLATEFDEDGNSQEADNTLLLFYKSERTKRKFYDLAKALKVVKGKMTKRLMKKSADFANPDHCFSICMTNGTTLDLMVESKGKVNAMRKRDKWVAALVEVMKARMDFVSHGKDLRRPTVETSPKPDRGRSRTQSKSPGLEHRESQQGQGQYDQYEGQQVHQEQDEENIQFEPDYKHVKKEEALGADGGME